MAPARCGGIVEARHLGMTLHAGHCTQCGAPTWVAARHGKTGERFLLFPLPDSVYARIQRQPGSHTPGIGYCAAHAPAPGTPGPAEVGGDPVAALDPAPTRYAYWYSPDYGAWLTSWATDELHLTEPDKQALLAEWTRCAEVARG